MMNLMLAFCSYLENLLGGSIFFSRSVSPDPVYSLQFVKGHAVLSVGSVYTFKATLCTTRFNIQKFYMVLTLHL